MEKDQTIELRSEKACKVIEHIPPVLVRSGITLITVILGTLFIAAYFIPYPENIKGIAIVEDVQNSKCYVDVIIPYKDVYRIEKSMPVKVEWEGYDGRIFGYLNGNILQVDKRVITISGENHFKARADLVLESDKTEIHKQMKGTAYILLSDKSVLSNLISLIIK